MPTSSEAEANFLGAAIMESTETMAIADELGVDADCFWNPVHRQVWELFKPLHDQRGPADLAMLWEQVKARRMEAGIPIQVLMGLTDMIRHTSRAKFFAERLVELRQLRRVMEAATDIHAHVAEYKGDQADMRAKLEAAQTTISGFTLRERGERLAEVCKRVKQSFADQRAGKPMPGHNITIGLPIADAKLHALNSKRDFYNILAARPSCGKTSLATQMIQNTLAVVPDSIVVDFQLENSRDNHVAQMAARFAQVNLYKPGEWDEKKQGAFNDYLDRMAAISDKRLYVFEADNAIEQIKSRLRQLKAKHGKISLVVIDYIQLVTTYLKLNPREALNHISRELKHLAKEIECPFLILAQLSREFEKEEREPQLRDLKESGNLEADADRVWMLHVNPKSESVNGIRPVDLFQRKNKYGPTGAVRLAFKGETTTFFDRQKSDQSQAEV